MVEEKDDVMTWSGILVAFGMRVIQALLVSKLRSSVCGLGELEEPVEERM